MQANEGKLIST
jgi:Ca2+-binding EF-hand superfamily protein